MISPIVGLTLILVTGTPLPLVSDLLNFTAVLKSGTAQQYEWMSSDSWTAVTTKPNVTHRYLSSGHHSMTVNVSNSLDYRLTSLNFTVHRRTGARLTYSQVPRTAVVGQTFVLSVSVEAVADSLLACSLSSTTLYSKLFLVNIWVLNLPPRNYSMQIPCCFLKHADTYFASEDRIVPTFNA